MAILEILKIFQKGHVAALDPRNRISSAPKISFLSAFPKFLIFFK